MRSSAWSSLVISASSAAAVALVIAPAGAAHLSVSPNTAEEGADVDLVFSVPNEHSALGVVSVTVGAPREFAIDDGEAKTGWSQSHTGQAITWSGGHIPKGEYATFGVRGTAPKRTETILFNVLVGTRDGKTQTYRVALAVTSGSTRDSGARTLGKAALFVALGAAAIAVGGGFLALYAWLRPPPP
jgi:uncharacterized protein YcnI